jgi:hypothetical protein
MLANHPVAKQQHALGNLIKDSAATAGLRRKDIGA